ncbi:hypothetical protein SAMN02910370_00935 [Lachnospiraceae bacterium XPB1003]|nr:hypothetical protein SAMN02910370_00935 [Lachnospiraceae bacterium XPB1003]
MEILAHRGLWKKVNEKNSLDVLKAAFDKGYGIETDIRDYKGKLVISHNIADEKSADLEELFAYYAGKKCDSTLALNVKADGIQDLLNGLLLKYGIKNYFLFDMSVPEMVVNRKMNLNYYSRKSDVEKETVMIDDAIGVWVDRFYDDFLDLEYIKKVISLKKKVSIVSPELHGFSYIEAWGKIRDEIGKSVYIQLCTDKPEEAEEFFHG